MMTNELSATRIAKQQHSDLMRAAAEARLARAAIADDDRRSAWGGVSVLSSALKRFLTPAHTPRAPHWRGARDDA